LGSGPGGLSSDAAAAKLRLVGPNSVEDASHLSALRLLLRQFESPLVLILIFAAAISLVLQQWVDSAIILAIVLGSTLLGFFQEYRASAAVEQLKRRLALTCRVMRDGVERMVPVSTVVPGDLVLLSAGNLIPADGLVIEAEDFLVSEASMTGESFPVEKQPGIVKPEAGLAARTNAVFPAPRCKAARRRSSSPKPVCELRSGRSRHGSGPASPRRILGAACASSDTC
jgi:P-type Mg2+ transporter